MRWLFITVSAVIVMVSSQHGVTQQVAPIVGSDSHRTAVSNPVQTAQIVGIDSLFERFTSIQAHRACGAPATIEELTTRQELLEAVQKATLDVDGVLAEIANEQGQLSNLRTSLQFRRDTTVARLNAAALITGSGAGAAVSATQFTGFGGRTNNIGDGVGVGAGAASTILSIIAARKQNGSRQSVGSIPNMLAPLFDQQPVLNTYYPPAVLRYLQAIPANEDAARGTRLDQLKAMWVESGRLDRSGPKRQADIAALTTSSNATVKVSIQDLSTRIAMLLDVSGRVSLMKRDLSGFLHFYMSTTSKCSQE